MKILEKYLGTKTYMAPSGVLMTPEEMQRQFPAILAFAHIIETDENGEMCWAVENLSAMRSMHDIDPALSEAEAIAALQMIVNTVPEVVEMVTPEERIAAALEYQNLTTMPDATE